MARKRHGHVSQKLYLTGSILPISLHCQATNTRDASRREYEVLCVSQFTLFAKLQKHDRPDFHHAMGAAEARELYSRLLAHMGGMYDPSKIKVGKGASWTWRLILIDDTKQQREASSPSGIWWERPSD